MTQNFSSFPNTRLRRNRKSSWIRDLLAQNSININDLIMPFFVIEGKNKKEKIESMADIYRFSIDLLITEVKKCQKLGIKAIMLFPSINQDLKNANGTESYNEDNLICQAIRAIKKEVHNIGIICDVALDPFTSHGQDGVLSQNNEVLNDETNAILCKQALAQAKAGCDIIAPSDMMDGRVGQIRKYLDNNGYKNVGIMSYSAKYASNFYGPFRDAVNSKNNLQGDKKSYQMDFRNQNEALREIEMDINEGADMIIIKPAALYLDIISKTKDKFNIPIISYQVSGEYTMLKLAAENNLLNFDEAMMESLICLKRAGSDAIITYSAMHIANLLS
ncbi:porphobilinogen synthase [Rickettsiales bacterium]|nr:porphobilinogen synthase [Rickettsiales bacterium]